MIRKELSLIINSILVPLAAGIFIFPAAYRAILSGSDIQNSVIYFTGLGMSISGPIILLGIIVSLFHLGNPYRAYRSIKKIDTSWLSREVFFTGAFFALWLVYFVFDKTGLPNSYVISLTVLAGILSIVSMANIYHSTGKPGWSGFSTYTGFLGSIVILGSIGSATFAVYSRSNYSEVTDLLITSVFMALLVLAVRFIQQIVIFRKLKPDDTEFSLDILVSSSSLTGSVISGYKNYITWGWVLSFSGVSITLIQLMRGEAPLNIILIISAAFVLTGEFLGRCGFYILGPQESITVIK